MPNNHSKFFTIYVLRLRHKCIYVGKTNNLQQRLKTHNLGGGPHWTRIHKPIEVIFSINTDDPYMEDKITKELVAEFGEEYVRGGSYTDPDCTDFNDEEKEYCTANNLCFICHDCDHFTTDCPYR